MEQEFLYPDFFAGTTSEEIHQRMMASLPDDIDGMPGGFAYDFTKPTADEKSEIIQFHLVRTLMIAFPNWAWGSWLDIHAGQKGLVRKGAGYASGSVTITGEAGTQLVAGFVVCTAATDSAPSVMFKLAEDATIGEDGTVTVPIIAAEPGPGSNVQAKSITIMSVPVKGITMIENQEDITGGTEEESDAELRQRLDEAYASESDSYIGNDADLKRWAKEVTGIRDCIVIPAAEGPGTIKLALVDSNGEPANQKLCTDVYNHIISPDDREKRILQTGSAKLIVEGATTTPIAYSCTDLECAEGTDAGQIQEAFKAAMVTYHQQAKDDGEIKYNIAHATLTGLSGVLDFRNFAVNGGTENVQLSEAEYPTVGDVTFSE